MTAWLQAHPTIRVVTRDRDEAFAKAIAAGAPDATQVADRFHLLLNLGDLLERLWARLARRPRSATSPPWRRRCLPQIRPTLCPLNKRGGRRFST